MKKSLSLIALIGMTVSLYGCGSQTFEIVDGDLPEGSRFSINYDIFNGFSCGSEQGACAFIQAD